MVSLEAHEKRLERHYENDTKNAFQSKINTQSQKSKKGGRNVMEKNRLLIIVSILHMVFTKEKDTWRRMLV